jgi:hypothetical protein
MQVLTFHCICTIFQEVMRYLKGQGRQLKLWSCRNAIQQVYTRHNPVPHIGKSCICDIIEASSPQTCSREHCIFIRLITIKNDNIIIQTIL